MSGFKTGFGLASGFGCAAAGCALLVILAVGGVVVALAVAGANTHHSARR